MPLERPAPMQQRQLDFKDASSVPSSIRHVRLSRYAGMNARSQAREKPLTADIVAKGCTVTSAFHIRKCMLLLIIIRYSLLLLAVRPGG